MSSSLVYSSTTGQNPFVTSVERDEAWVGRDMSDYLPENDPHCFVCGRHTDHFGEHDSLVALGLASYGDESSSFDRGSVFVTELARTKLGMAMRDVYDAAVTRSYVKRGVSLIKPEGEVMTFLGTMDTAG